jgi:hypothetical protein
MGDAGPVRGACAFRLAPVDRAPFEEEWLQRTREERQRFEASVPWFHPWQTGAGGAEVLERLVVETPDDDDSLAVELTAHNGSPLRWETGPTLAAVPCDHPDPTGCHCGRYFMAALYERHSSAPLHHLVGHHVVAEVRAEELLPADNRPWVTEPMREVYEIEMCRASTLLVERLWVSPYVERWIPQLRAQLGAPDLAVQVVPGLDSPDLDKRQAQIRRLYALSAKWLAAR